MSACERKKDKNHENVDIVLNMTDNINNDQNISSTEQ